MRRLTWLVTMHAVTVGAFFLTVACEPKPPEAPSDIIDAEAAPGPRIAAAKLPHVDVQVDMGLCTQDAANTFGKGDAITLNCKAPDGKSSLIVLLGRKEWYMMQKDGYGTIDAGPGK